MGITFGDHMIDSGYYDITPEQEREIEAREECKRRGLNPDGDAADGVQVWMVVDQELRERAPARCPDDPCVCDIVGRTECIHHKPPNTSEVRHFKNRVGRDHWAEGDMTTTCKFCGTDPNAGETACSTTKEARQCGWMGESDWKRYEEANRPKRPQAAIDNLTSHQVQCDMDGVMIQVSRQALCEVLDYLTPPKFPGDSYGGL